MRGSSYLLILICCFYIFSCKNESSSYLYSNKINIDSLILNSSDSLVARSCDEHVFCHINSNFILAIAHPKQKRYDTIYEELVNTNLLYFKDDDASLDQFCSCFRNDNFHIIDSTKAKVKFKLYKPDKNILEQDFYISLFLSQLKYLDSSSNEIKSLNNILVKKLNSWESYGG